MDLSYIGRVHPDLLHHLLQEDLHPHILQHLELTHLLQQVLVGYVHSLRIQMQHLECFMQLPRLEGITLLVYQRLP